MAFLEEDEKLQMNEESDFHQCESFQENQIQNFYCKICGIKLHPLHPLITYHRSQEYQNTRYSKETQISLDLMHQRQNSNRIFIPQHRHADVRQSIIDYISNLSAKLTYNRQTLHLAIAIMDLTFGEYTFQQNEIILICIIVIIIAAKVHEPNYKIPLVEDIIFKLNGMFTVEDYIQYESIIFDKILHYSADIETTYKFTEEFLYRGILNDKEIGYNIIEQDISQQLMEFFQDMVRNLTDMSLNFYELYKYQASTVAAAIIMLARKIFGTEQLWSQHLIDLTSEDEEIVKKCANELYELLLKSMGQRLKQIYRCQKQFTFRIREYLLQNQYIKKSSKNELNNCSLAQLLQKVREIKEHEKTCSSIAIQLEGSNLLHPNEDSEEENSQRGILFKKP